MPNGKGRAKRPDPFDVSHLVAESAERQVLAGLLDILDREYLTAVDIVSDLAGEMFYGTATCDVFNALAASIKATARATRADVLTGLRRAGHDQGSEAFTLFVDLVDDRIATGFEAARLAREAAAEIRQLHERRQAVEAAALVAKSGGHPDDITTLVRHLERVRAAGDQAAGGKPLSLVDCIDAWARHDRTPTVATGLRWFDDPTEGGLPIGGITGLVAYPKVGKTALALQMSLAALVTDPTLRCVWALGEMAPHSMGRRMACVGAAILADCEPVTMRDAGRRSKVARAASVTLCNAIGDRFAIVPAPLTLDAIDARVAATGARLVVIDYLQLIRSGERTSDRVQELDAIVGRLREMAINRECAVLMISSMAKSAGSTSRIGQFGKGSGEIDYAVELLYVGEREERDGQPVLAADGTVGVVWKCVGARNLDLRDLSLRFDGATQTYAADISWAVPEGGYTEFEAFNQGAAR